MADYTAPVEWTEIPEGAIPPSGTFLLPICTTAERLEKLLSALSVWRNLDDQNHDYDPISDVVSAIPFIQNLQASPCSDCEPDDCITYPPSFTRIIEYIPNNPYNAVQPEYHPFYVIHDPSPLTGFQDGDVLCDVISTGINPLDPPPGEDVTFPRFRVTFSGIGTIELHLLSVILGGMAQVQVDGEIGSLTYVDVNRDVTQIPPDNYSPVIYEHEFTVDGDHFIDVTFIPAVNDSITEVVGIGGGLRKIVLCGFDKVNPVPTFQFTEECGMEYRLSDTDDWLPIPGWSDFAYDCFKGADGAPGFDGSPGTPGADGGSGHPGYDGDGGVPDPEGTDNDAKRCKIATVLAEQMLSRYKGWLDAWIDILADNAGDYNAAYNELLNAASGSAVGGTIVDSTVGLGAGYWVAAFLVEILGVGAIIAGLTAYFAGKSLLGWIDIRDDIDDPDFFTNLYCLIYANLDIDGSVTSEHWHDILDGIEALSGASADARGDFGDFVAHDMPVALARLLALREPVSDPDCADCGDDGVWCQFDDFTTGQHSWTAIKGSWATGQGYNHADGANPLPSGSGDERSAYIHTTFPARVVTKIQFTFNRVPGSVSAGGTIARIFGINSTTTVVDQNSATSYSGTGLTYTWTGSATMTEIKAFIRASLKTNPQNGSVRITSIRWEGTGTHPRGTADNCP